MPDSHLQTQHGNPPAATLQNDTTLETAALKRRIAQLEAEKAPKPKRKKDE